MDSFGRRRPPADVVEILSDDEQEVDISTTPACSKAAAVEPTRSETLFSSMATSPEPRHDMELEEENTRRSEVGNLHQEEVEQEPPEKELFGYDSTLVSAWLDTSVTAATPGATPDNSLDSPVESVSRRRDELEALKSLNRVHFVQKVPETRPLQDTVETYSDMTLDTQIYLRKVVDRFPSLPPYLAKRFANANVRRAQRLRAANGTIEPTADCNGTEL